MKGLTLRVQVPDNHILTQNLYYNYNYYYPKPKYLIIGYLDPLGKGAIRVRCNSEGKDPIAPMISCGPR